MALPADPLDRRWDTVADGQQITINCKYNDNKFRIVITKYWRARVAVYGVVDNREQKIDQTRVFTYGTIRGSLADIFYKFDIAATDIEFVGIN